MAEPADLYDLAAELLEAAEQALSTTDAGIPARALLSPGPPPWDCCDQLSVHVLSPAVADTEVGVGALATGHRIQTAGSVYIIDLIVTILRCVPTLGDDGELPTPLDLTAAAKTTYDDIWALWNYLSARIRAGDIFAPVEREKYLGIPTPQANGGCGGWTLPVRIQLDGYSPAQVIL